MSRTNQLNRRDFQILSALAFSSTTVFSRTATAQEKQNNAIRLGGPVFEKYDSPDTWVKSVQREGYTAAYCPVNAKTGSEAIKAYQQAAKEADIVIAEVGAWSNPMDPDDEKRKQALEKCKTQLALADEIGANCCVNISGSVGEKWDGHHPGNLTDETFDLIVETTRQIIDAVKPKRSYYTLETMPWAYPDSPDSYLRLLKAMDRKRFAAHMDPVNIVSSPQRYYNNGALIRECFEKLGPHIKSCHAKDIIMRQKLTVHLDEIRPGLGNLNYAVYLREAAKLDVPVMLEHLPSAEEYRKAAEYVREVAEEEMILIR